MSQSGGGAGSDRRGLVKAMALGGAAAVMTASVALDGDGLAATSDVPVRDMTADQVRALLDLEPHPTCGFVRLTFVSDKRIAPGGLPAPFEAGRPLGSALMFMVTDARSVRLHRIKNDQLYHFYLGAPLEVIMLMQGAQSKRVVVGPNIAAGQQLQLMIPGGTFHTARLHGEGEWFLGASTEWPGVEPADVETGDLEALVGQYPAVAADLRDFARTASR